MSREAGRDFIVKVQIPLVTSEPNPMCLVYNEDRSVMDQFPISRSLRSLLRGQLKSFWHAHLIPDPKKKGAFLVSIDRRAPWQEW